MKVILLADVTNVGHRGDVVDVADGYARNHLIPNGNAMRATDGAVAQAQAMRRARDVQNTRDREAAQEIATRLVPQVITIRAKASPEGRLFGSVGAAEIVAAVAAQAKIELDRKTIRLDEPLKEVGQHMVMASLHPEVQFPVTLDVVADE